VERSFPSACRGGRECERVLQTDSDISALQSAIKDDGPLEPEQKDFGPAVKSWIKTMWGKAVDTAWNVELGIAAGLLTEALKAFYF
jgi:hypothetical protein